MGLVGCLVVGWFGLVWFGCFGADLLKKSFFVVLSVWGFLVGWGGGWGVGVGFMVRFSRVFSGFSMFFFWWFWPY